MNLYGSVQYRGRRIYLSRKRLHPDGRWKWAQESTGLSRGDEPVALQLLEEHNAHELARYKLRALVAQPIDARIPTVESYARKWIDLRKRRHLTSAFDDERRFRLHIWPYSIDGVARLGDIPLPAVRSPHIRAWVTGLASTELAPRTVRNLYSLVRAMFEDAYADELVDNNPCRLRRGDLPKSEDKNPRWRASAIFTREEVVSLISDERIPIDRQALYATAFLTASRSGELSALRVEDYDASVTPLARLTIGESYSPWLGRPKSTKTGVTRLVPVHPVLRSILDEWLASGFETVFGRAPQKNDLLFPARPPGRSAARAIDYDQQQRQHPSLTRAELARILGVTRAAVTQGLRPRSRMPQLLDRAYRLPKANYQRLKDDLRRLELRPRRLHDAKRTAVSFLAEDGVRDPILTYLAWGPQKNVRDLYITLPWEALCAEVLKLRLPASCSSSCSRPAGA
jgi:integrase